MQELPRKSGKNPADIFMNCFREFSIETSGIEEVDSGLQLGTGEQIGIPGKKRPGIFLRPKQDLGIRSQIGQMHLRKTVLPVAEEVAGTAEAQILFRNLKAVIGLAHDIQTGTDGFLLMV